MNSKMKQINGVLHVEYKDFADVVAERDRLKAVAEAVVYQLDHYKGETRERLLDSVDEYLITMAKNALGGDDG